MLQKVDEPAALMRTPVKCEQCVFFCLTSISIRKYEAYFCTFMEYRSKIF